MYIFEPPSCEDKFTYKYINPFGNKNKHYKGEKFTYSHDGEKIIFELTRDVKYDDVNVYLFAKIPEHDDGREYKFLIRPKDTLPECAYAQGGKRQSRKQKKSLKRKPRKQKKSLKKRR
jgi:hypothetical protein